MVDPLTVAPARSRFADVLAKGESSHGHSGSSSTSSHEAFKASTRESVAGPKLHVRLHEEGKGTAGRVTVEPRSHSHLESMIKLLTSRGERASDEDYEDKVKDCARQYASRLEDAAVPEEDRVDGLRDAIRDTLVDQAAYDSLLQLLSRVNLDDAVLEFMHAHRQDLQGPDGNTKPRPLSRTSSNRSLNSRTTPSSPLMKTTLLPNIRRGSTAKILPPFRAAASGIATINTSIGDSISRPSSAADSRPGTPTTPLGSPAKLSAFASEFRPGGSEGFSNLAKVSMASPSGSVKSSAAKSDGNLWNRPLAPQNDMLNSIEGKASIMEDEIALPDLFADPDDVSDIFDAFDPFSASSGDADGIKSRNGESDGDLSPLELLKAVVAGLPPEIAEAGSFIDQDFEQALTSTNYDVEAALDLLLRNQEIDMALSELETSLAVPTGPYKPAGSDGGASDIAESPSHASSSRSTKICRHFLQGECRRSDCRFSHELNIVCRFWAQGRCSKADCTFLHSMDGHLVTSDTEDFPSSGSNMSHREPAIVARPAGSQQKPADDREAFPGLPTANVVPKAPNGSVLTIPTKTDALTPGGFAGVARKAPPGPLRSRERPQTPPSGKTIGPAYAAPRASSSTNDAGKGPNTEHRAGPRRTLHPRFPLVAPTSIPHLVTGSELNSSYMRKRSQAAEHARHRNLCLQRAAEAFRRGDTAGAKRWSVLGREADQKMLSSHRQAAQEIFESRNQDMSRRSGSSGAWVDLHGLHPAEAVELLENWLIRLEKENHNAPVYIVVGKASHSHASGGGQHAGGSGRGRLAKEVISFLQQWSYPMKEFTVGSLGGIIAVDAAVHL